MEATRNICEVCEMAEAVRHCKDCPKIHLFCEKCFDFVHKTESKKKHKTTILPSYDNNEQPIPICVDHPKEIRKYVCLSCNKSICGECAAHGFHKGHKLDVFTGGLGKSNSMLVYALSKQREKEEPKSALEYLDTKIENLRQLFCKAKLDMGILKSMIKDREHDILAKIDQELVERTNFRKVFEVLDVRMKTSIEEYNFLVSRGSRASVENYDMLIKKMVELKEMWTIYEKLAPMKATVAGCYTPISLAELMEAVQKLDIVRAPLHSIVPSQKLVEPSIIRDVQHLALLDKWVSESLHVARVSFLLIYRGTVDGLQAETFHKKCDWVTPTLTLIETTNGFIFGGFTTVPWRHYGDYVYDHQAFIFSLTLKAKHSTQKDKKFSVFPHRDFGPTFGGGHDIYIELNGKLENSYSSGDYTYELPPGIDGNLYFAGAKKFTPKEIEVYTVIVRAD